MSMVRMQFRPRRRVLAAVVGALLVVGVSTAPASAQQQGPPDPGIPAQADGSLRNPQSGRCLDSPNGATGNGTRLQIWDCNGSGAQKFALV
jgi:hypothetical protein